MFTRNQGGRNATLRSRAQQTPPDPLPSDVEITDWQEINQGSLVASFSIRLDMVTIHNCRWMYSSKTNSEFAALPSRKLDNGTWQTIVSLPRSWREELNNWVESYLDAVAPPVAQDSLLFDLAVPGGQGGQRR